MSMSMNESASAALLGPQGPLARHLPDYQQRPAQLELAVAVERSIQQRQSLIAEAGSGIGKTFAYLVPALLSGRRVIISTATRQLQDQLSRRDLPRVLSALRLDYAAAQLKGRRNYLCPHHLQRHLSEGRQPAPILRQLRQVQQWARQMPSGELEEGALPETSALLPLLTSTPDNCLGARCPSVSRCPFRLARLRAQQAELVVVNHALLLADAQLAQSGMGGLLRGDEIVIVDEAHRLPELVMARFGHSFSSQAISALLRRLPGLQRRYAPDMRLLRELPQQLLQGLMALQRRLAASDRDPEGTTATQALLQGMGTLQAGLSKLQQVMALAAPRASELQRVALELDQLCARLASFREGEAGAAEEQTALWHEVSAEGFSLHRAPVSAAAAFTQLRQRDDATWLFISATLAVAGSVDHFARQLGVREYQALVLPGAYDYARNALCYLPAGIPEPDSDAYNSAVVAAALPVIRASGGRTFFLFTSHRALQAAAQQLAGRLEFPLLVQGIASNSRLLAQFRQLGNAVLLGAASFWEGVDVRGADLSCVIIDRLPFSAPDAPLLQARMRQLRRAGIDPFLAEQLPQAVVALRQGVGRLLRDSRDRGVLMIADPRLTTRAYGALFLQSLPPLPVTRELADVQAFFTGSVGAEPSN